MRNNCLLQIWNSWPLAPQGEARMPFLVVFKTSMWLIWKLNSGNDTYWKECYFCGCIEMIQRGLGSSSEKQDMLGASSYWNKNKPPCWTWSFQWKVGVPAGAHANMHSFHQQWFTVCALPGAVVSGDAAEGHSPVLDRAADLWCTWVIANNIIIMNRNPRPMTGLALYSFRWKLVGPQHSFRHWDCCPGGWQGPASVFSYLQNSEFITGRYWCIFCVPVTYNCDIVSLWCHIVSSRELVHASQGGISEMTCVANIWIYIV